MRRILLGLVIGVLAFGAGAAGAKVVNVTNPMSADLDGGGHNVSNVANYQTSAGAVFGGDGFSGWTLVFGMSPQTGPLAAPFTLDFAGTADPSIAPPVGNNPVGSLYRQRIDSAHAALWFKTGPIATDWTLVVRSP
jgi:hypothetical protein